MGLEWEPSVSGLALLSGAALALGALLWLRGLPFMLPVLAIVVIMGVVRVEAASGPDPLAFLTESGGMTGVRGTVVSDPDLAGQGVEFEFSLEALNTDRGWEEVGGKARVVARPPAGLVLDRDEPYFRYGDRLELKGN